MTDSDKYKQLLLKVFVSFVYGGEIALAVLAALALFRVVAAEAWWMIGLNTFQVLFVVGIALVLRNTFDYETRRFIIHVGVSAIVLVILVSVWKGVSDHDDAEVIGGNSNRHLFFTYLALAALRLYFFVEHTYSYIIILLFSTANKKQ